MRPCESSLCTTCTSGPLHLYTIAVCSLFGGFPSHLGHAPQFLRQASHHQNTFSVPIARRSAVPALVLTFAQLPEVRLCLDSFWYTVGKADSFLRLSSAMHVPLWESRPWRSKAAPSEQQDDARFRSSWLKCVFLCEWLQIPDGSHKPC